MKPLSDRELDERLRDWHAPLLPTTLERRIHGLVDKGGLKWLLTGTIRIPVPVILLTALMFIVVSFLGVRNQALKHTPGELQPVKKLEVRILRSNYEISH